MLEERLNKLPDKYKNTINKITEDALNIYKENLNTIFLAGSCGKGKCIPNWSDIDLYIVTNKLDFDQNLKFYSKSLGYEIHVGTTFYTADMVNKLYLQCRRCRRERRRGFRQTHKKQRERM